jgi:N-acetylglucosaminyldiphosphoundecaprenol N-acetyl-beta-D-mannosaminyltransferase
MVEHTPLEDAASPSVVIADVPVAQFELQPAVRAVVRRLMTPGAEPVAYRFVNSYSIALSTKNPQYRTLLNAPSGVNFADGRPLARVSARLSGGVFPHVRGPSFFMMVLDEGRSLGMRHFFLGGSPQLLSQLQLEATLCYPGLVIAGTFSPPFRPMTAAEKRDQDELIRQAEPHIVWVGLGTPKQDFEAQRIVAALGVSAAGVGAAFDFLAGTKPEAPAWMRRRGFEWVFRLATEPRRLWRRYLFGNPVFLRAVLPELIRGRR